MSEEWLEEAIRVLLPKLESTGIVTAEDSIYLDIRHHSREISHYLDEKGYTQYKYIEVKADNCPVPVYTAAIYNPKKFSYEKAVAYTKHYIDQDF